MLGGLLGMIPERFSLMIAGESYDHWWLMNGKNLNPIGRHYHKTKNGLHNTSISYFAIWMGVGLSAERDSDIKWQRPKCSLQKSKLIDQTHMKRDLTD